MVAPTSPLASSTLQAPAQPAAQRYTLTTQTFHHLGNRAYENTTETLFEKIPLGPGAHGPVVRVLLRGFTESNPRGLNQLDALLAELKEELVIETNAAGGLGRILNKEQLAQKYQKLRPVLLRQAEGLPLLKPTIIANIGLLFAGEGYLEDVLRASPEYGLLLPGLYGCTYSAEPMALGTRLLPRILGNVDLPLQVAATRTPTVPPDVAYGVYVTGRVDEEHFRAGDLQQALRTITDRFDLDTTLRARHQESYEFDAAGELRYAARLSDYGVAGVFSTQQVCTLQHTIFTSTP
ncbi:MAG: hypothetical protein ACRYFK_20330 [Janthinobacterium lividum]